MDFYKIIVEKTEGPRSKTDYIIYPDFLYMTSTDIVIKGGTFFAFWNGTKWSKNMNDLIMQIDKDCWDKYEELKSTNQDLRIAVRSMNQESSGIMQRFVNYCKKKQSDAVMFNTRVLFSDHVIKKEDYSTYQLNYTPTSGPTPAFDKMMSTLYNQNELDKILWAVGALFTGKIEKIEKFLYLYGPNGSGKGTVMNIIKNMLGSYWAPIDLQTLCGSSEYATAGVDEVPMLIDADTDLTKIKKETNILKLTSHEELIKRKLYQDGYPVTFKGLLITASNDRYIVKNKDSGLVRRPIVVNPSGRKIPFEEYHILNDQVQFEFPAIAQKAIDKFEELGKSYYRDEVNVDMVAYSDKVFDFIRENYYDMSNGITLKRAADMYKMYLEDMGWDSKGAKRQLKESLGKYFNTYKSDTKLADGTRVYDYYTDFRMEVAFPESVKKIKPSEAALINMQDEMPKTFDKEGRDWPAQYANADGLPSIKWDEVTTTLKDLDTSKLHYVRVPYNHIVLDFDLKNKEGEKDYKLNLRKASKYPETYTEVSKSGGGIHLHYYYDGDVSKLAPLIEEDVEIKVFSGKMALRRKLSFGHDVPIAHISTGLPFKEEKDEMFKDIENIAWTERKLKAFIDAAVNKEHHGATKPEIDFIVKVLQDAYDSGVTYDLVALRQKVVEFAMSSSNHKDYCLREVAKMKFSSDKFKGTSEHMIETQVIPDEDLFFYDVEIYPNLFLVVFKQYGKPMTKWYNPTPEQIAWLMEKPLVGFNNRLYDNHVTYNRYLGADLMDLYKQSQGIINKVQSVMIPSAYNVSYADLYEFMDVRQSLKKWELEMLKDGTLEKFTSEMIGEDISNLEHDEMELPWDQPAPEDMWPRIGEYCGHDVVWTEILFRSDHGQAPYFARKIMAELTGLPINTKTQTLAEKFLFGNDPRPQDKFVWYDLATEFPGYKYDKFAKIKSDYKGRNPSEGGYVYSEPGVYRNVALFDVESLHPHSLIAINYFGEYTPKFAALVACRMYIKHGRLEEAAHAFDEIDIELSKKLAKYLEDDSMADALAHAMKIIINIVYGMTSASFDNKFRHPGNIDNIVAKRGALFMMQTQDEVEAMGQKIIHVKTDSFKMPNLVHGSDRQKEIYDYIQSRAHEYGYNFDYEANFDKLALTNKAVIIGHIVYNVKPKKIGHWEAIGPTYAEPYVHKSLFTHEDFVESDYQQFKQAKSSIYLDDKFIGKNANVYASKTGGTLYRTGEIDLAKKAQTRWMKQLSPEKAAKDLGIEVEHYNDIVNSNFKPEMVTTYNSVSGTKGFKWRQWSDYKGVDDIDMTYYEGLVKDAVDGIYKVGDGNIIFEGTSWERKTETFSEQLQQV